MLKRVQAAVGATAMLLCASRAASALELTGVLMYRLTMENQEGPFWCTAPAAHRCRPLGLTGVAPPAMKKVRLLNAQDGAVAVPLPPGSQIFTSFWHYVPGEFPVVMMVLDLYFNGDNDT